MATHDISYAEDLNWCKQRAIEALSYGGIKDAAASLASDLRKSESTRNHSAGRDLLALIVNGATASEVKQFITDIR